MACTYAVCIFFLFSFLYNSIQSNEYVHPLSLFFLLLFISLCTSYCYYYYLYLCVCTRLYESDKQQKNKLEFSLFAVITAPAVVYVMCTGILLIVVVVVLLPLCSSFSTIYYKKKHFSFCF